MPACPGPMTAVSFPLGGGGLRFCVCQAQSARASLRSEGSSDPAVRGRRTEQRETQQGGGGDGGFWSWEGDRLDVP